MNEPTQVFDAWRGLGLDDILALCRDTVEDPEHPVARRWRAQGGPVVGHFQVYFPAEIAHAAGALPLKLSGGQVEPQQADSRFGSYLCSIVKTTLELALSGRVELDLFVTHPICDAARNLAAIFERNFDHPAQILYLPQNVGSAATVSYLTDEYNRLKGVIEEVVGREVTDVALRRSVASYNENRALMRELYDIKRETPWLVEAEDAYCLVALSGRVPVEAHNALMRTVLPLIRAREARPEDRVRVVFEGAFCEQPPLDLIRMVGRSCYIVDDDFLIGLRWLTGHVDCGDDPLRALARAYVAQSSYSPVQHDPDKPKERMLLRRVDGARAEAVVLGAAKMCEPGLEEQVAYITALEERGLPHFVSEFEENMTSFSSLELQVETFAENLLFS